MNKYDYKDKYNFQIFSEVDKINENKIYNINMFPKFNILNNFIGRNISDISENNDSYKIEVVRNVENFDKLKIEKIKIDSKTYYRNLQRKLILNFEIFKVFIENFYTDDFTNTRNASYILFGLPTSIILGYYFISPYHPMRSLITNSSIIASIIFFGYYYIDDLNNITNKDNKIGNKLKLIRNEIALYNPLVNPFLDNKEN